MPGLSVSDVVNVSINLAPVAVPLRNFGTLCIAGPSTSIDVSQRIRAYTTLDGVAADFGTTAPEYLAANLYFAQQPRPAILYVGRWAQTASAAVLHGGLLTTALQTTLLAQLKLVTNGTFQITIDGILRTVAASPAYIQGGPFASTGTPPTAQDTLVTTLSAITNGAFKLTIDGTNKDTGLIDFKTVPLAGVTTTDKLTDAALRINTGLQIGALKATCTWDSAFGGFVVRSATTGVASTITAATAGAAGTDISATLKLTTALLAQSPITPGSTGMNFTNITNLNGAATIITAALTSGHCWFDGDNFHIEASSYGTASTITYASATGTGQDISTPLHLTQATGASVPVNGIAAETPLAAAVALRSHPEWYGLQLVSATMPTTSDHVAVANFIEACDPVSLYGYTSQDTAVIDPTITTDVASQMKALQFTRTFGQYSSSSPYACASIFGRAFTVDFEGSNTVITLKFKTEPGVAGEQLTETAAAALKLKNCNVFVYYSNDVAIVQEGVMCSGMFFDERHNMDWIANRVQTDLFNVLYTSNTKIPQTNAGIHILTTTVEHALQQGVVNGTIAPGQWNAPGFGQIDYGQFLPKGYYVWAPLVEDQPQAIREARIAPTIQAAIKLAGAVHKANVIINVNR
jgi:hypothetical protein